MKLHQIVQNAIRNRSCSHYNGHHRKPSHEYNLISVNFWMIYFPDEYPAKQTIFRASFRTKELPLIRSKMANLEHLPLVTRSKKLQLTGTILCSTNGFEEARIIRHTVWIGIKRHSDVWGTHLTVFRRAHCVSFAYVCVHRNMRRRRQR